MIASFGGVLKAAKANEESTRRPPHRGDAPSEIPSRTVAIAAGHPGILPIGRPLRLRRTPRRSPARPAPQPVHRTSLGARCSRSKKQRKKCGSAEPGQIAHRHDLPAFRSRQDAQYRDPSRRIGTENTYRAPAPSRGPRRCRPAAISGSPLAIQKGAAERKGYGPPSMRRHVSRPFQLATPTRVWRCLVTLFNRSLPAQRGRTKRSILTWLAGRPHTGAPPSGRHNVGSLGVWPFHLQAIRQVAAQIGVRTPTSNNWGQRFHWVHAASDMKIGALADACVASRVRNRRERARRARSAPPSKCAEASGRLRRRNFGRTVGAP